VRISVAAPARFAIFTTPFESALVPTARFRSALATRLSREKPRGHSPLCAQAIVFKRKPCHGV
jgi:hypothetical protein